MLWIIKLVVIFYIFAVIFYLNKLQKYNSVNDVIHVDSKTKANLELKQLLPIMWFDSDSDINLIKNDISFVDNDKEYNTSEYFKDDKDIFIYKNKELIKKIDIKTIESQISFLNNIVYAIPYYSISLFKGNQITSIQKCDRNKTMLWTLDGYSYIYLINPKNKDICNEKSVDELKKWSYKLILQPKTKLIIPTNWLYFLDVKTKTQIIHFEIDNIYTFIPHFIKNKLR